MVENDASVLKLVQEVTAGHQVHMHLPVCVRVWNASRSCQYHTLMTRNANNTASGHIFPERSHVTR